MPKISGSAPIKSILTRMAKESPSGMTIGLWGLTTPDGASGPSSETLALVQVLLALGARIQAFLPFIDATLEGVELVSDAYQAARDADLLVILGSPCEFTDVDMVKVREIMTSPRIIDLTNECVSRSTADLGFSYEGTDSAGASGIDAISNARSLAPPSRQPGHDETSRIRDYESSDHRSFDVAQGRRRTVDAPGDMQPEPALAAGARGLVAKRAFDLAVGIPLALAALPLIVLFAVGIAVSFRCWPFFTQLRVGKGGKPFRFLKIRTLPPNTPAYAHKSNLDTASLPRLARFLRKQHLDELPQLLLVALGKMSLVGPRPKMPDDKEPIDRTYGRLRTSVPQGCTGLWQIGEHAHLRVCDSADYDYAYLHHGGVRMDVWILWRTALLLIGKNTPVALDDESAIPRRARGRGFDVALASPLEHAA